MKTFGLIGFPLSHSFSARYFTEKFLREGIADCRFQLFPLEHIGGFSRLIDEQSSLCGLNVTIPYKQQIIPFLHTMDAAAAEIGAVNCIAFSRTHGMLRLKGYNTDAYGFESSLVPLLKPWHQQALIFGNGGAATAVKYVLQKLNISYRVVSRTPGDLTYGELDRSFMESHTLLINTTPLGMHPDTEKCPDIPYQYMGEKHLAYDLIYNPAETRFLHTAAARGSVIKNGLEMLYLQAEKSWYIWNRE